MANIYGQGCWIIHGRVEVGGYNKGKFGAIMSDLLTYGGGWGVGGKPGVMEYCLLQGCVRS